MLSPIRVLPCLLFVASAHAQATFPLDFADVESTTGGLRYTLAHEIGHAIGLDHPNAPGQIMGYRYEESFRDLQPGDLSGAVALYGPSRGVMMAH